MRMLDFKPALVKSCIQRSSAASEAGRSTEDAWHQFLQLKVGASGTIADLEPRYLRANGGSGEYTTGLWRTYLDARGFSGGNVHDRMRAFLASGTLV